MFQGPKRGVLQFGGIWYFFMILNILDDKFQTQNT